jgi:hypothetical protein
VQEAIAVRKPRRKASSAFVNDPVGILDLKEPADWKLAKRMLEELRADEERLMKAKDELDLAESMLRISRARSDVIIAELHRFGYTDEQIEEARGRRRGAVS